MRIEGSPPVAFENALYERAFKATVANAIGSGVDATHVRNVQVGPAPSSLRRLLSPLSADAVAGADVRFEVFLPPAVSPFADAEALESAVDSALSAAEATFPGALRDAVDDLEPPEPAVDVDSDAFRTQREARASLHQAAQGYASNVKSATLVGVNCEDYCARRSSCPTN